MIEEEWNKHTKMDYYLAQIALLIDSIPSRIFGGKQPYSRTVPDFLIEFTGKKQDEEIRSFTPTNLKNLSEEDEELLAKYGDTFDPKNMTPDEKKACDGLKHSFFSDLGLTPEGKVSPALQREIEQSRTEQRTNPVIRKNK